jgi:HemY protein
MIRLLMFFLWVFFFAAMLTLLSRIDSVISAVAFGWRFDLPAGAAIAGALLLATALVGAAVVIKDIIGAPGALSARRTATRKEKGYLAVTQGLEAIAAGDGRDARKQAERAAKLLGAAPAARILAAQAAYIAGDEAAAEATLAELVEAPETQLLGLRAQYAKAIRNHDRIAAEAHAAEAFGLQPKARWAFVAAFDLALDRGDFPAARETLARAHKAKAIDADKARRGVAALTTAEAFAAFAAGDMARAGAEAEAAAKDAPELTPAAILAARLAASRGDARKAAKALAASFARAPAHALIEEFVRIHEAEPPPALADALDRIAGASASARAGRLARAHAALLRGEAAAATAIIEDALKNSATADALRLMAEAQGSLHGEAAAHVWLCLAVEAAADDGLRAEDYFRITPDGWRRLVREYMEHGRLTPPPLQETPPGLSDELMKSLMPPRTVPLIAPLATTESEPPPADHQETDDTLDLEADAARGVN